MKFVRVEKKELIKLIESHLKLYEIRLLIMSNFNNLVLLALIIKAINRK